MIDFQPPVWTILSILILLRPEMKVQKTIDEAKFIKIHRNLLTVVRITNIIDQNRF